MEKSFSYRFAGMVGNILEHYDTALFGLLAPYIASLFFADSDPLTALILTYCIVPAGILSKPLGSLIFGRIGDKYGRKHALSLSLIGMAIVTVGIGFLPTYKEVGMLAPLFLSLLRMLQGFFSAGETSGGAIFVLENAEPKKWNFLSSIFDATTIVGILIASVLVTLFSALGIIETAWRFLFFGGAVSALLGFILRIMTDEKVDYIPQQTVPLKQTIKENLKPLGAIIVCSGFSYITYSLAFVLMNAYIPLVTTLDRLDVMKVNSYLLVLDMLLLPTFGYLATRVGKERLMMGASLISALTAIPLFSFLDHSTLGTVIVVRCAIVVFGVAFGATYHAWAVERVPTHQRYTILSLGNALGVQIIGMPTSAVSLWLYKVTGLAFAPGIYLLVFGLLACYAIFKTAPAAKREKVRSESLDSEGNLGVVSA